MITTTAPTTKKAPPTSPLPKHRTATTIVPTLPEVLHIVPATPLHISPQSAAHHIFSEEKRRRRHQHLTCKTVATHLRSEKLSPIPSTPPPSSTATNTSPAKLVVATKTKTKTKAKTNTINIFLWCTLGGDPHSSDVLGKLLQTVLLRSSSRLLQKVPLYCNDTDLLVATLVMASGERGETDLNL
ncbi:Hypothetical predicted protein [Olea europaea subsp. europaea]|uniref:Uncharacterized protein n=1 Tax=Olea europaea subsp. europaea TaxID=158383 RepID=A0A8S0PWK4_OLEEU|nr:Hypothetical predicted protein [Olea europaea subsp. europaea]